MIKTNFKNNYDYDPQKAMDFTPFIDRLKGVTLYYGLGIDDDNIINDENFKVKINLETPNFIYDKSLYNQEKEFSKYDLILHLCPFTCKYLNKKFNTNKYKSIYFPINNVIYNKELERNVNVFYTGHNIQLEPITIIYKIMNKYIGLDTINKLNYEMSDKSIKGYYDKLKILNKTKICLIHNVLQSVNNFPNYNNFINDSLYKEIYPWHSNNNDLVPQLKSRTFEGALMGCILLVYKDKYNIIESFFQENEDFIYFDNYEDLDNKVNNILNSYESYKYLAINAQNKVINNYLVNNLVDFIVDIKNNN